jgi:hypothetical protein
VESNPVQIGSAPTPTPPVIAFTHTITVSGTKRALLLITEWATSACRAGRGLAGYLSLLRIKDRQPLLNLRVKEARRMERVENHVLSRGSTLVMNRQKTLLPKRFVDKQVLDFLAKTHFAEPISTLVDACISRAKAVRSHDCITKTFERQNALVCSVQAYIFLFGGQGECTHPPPRKIDVCIQIKDAPV